MDDLISRNALLAAYDAAHKGPPGGARKLIVEAPAVDAVPVRRGRWIEEGTAHPALGLSYYICSECKQFWGTFHKGFRLNTVYEYCPHCGADMREGEKDGTVG